MKLQPLLLILVASALIIATTGCRKQAACCAQEGGSAIFTKGTDTVVTFATGEPYHTLYDSINYYQGQGFTMLNDSVHFIFMGLVYGKQQINESIAIGDNCNSNFDGLEPACP